MVHEMSCSACGRGMSLRDLDGRTFRELNGKLYCPECVLKMEQPKKMRCPHCGTQTIALMQQGVYICTHCKQPIGGEQHDGVIEAARPSGSRGLDVHVPVAPRTPTPRAQAARRRGVLTLLVALFIMFTLVLGALLVHAEFALRDIRTQLAAQGALAAAPAAAEPVSTSASRAADEKALQVAEGTARVAAENYGQAITAYEEALKAMSDPVLKQKALGAIEVLRIRRDTAAERAKDRKDLEELQAKLVKATQEIDQLKKAAASSVTVAVRPEERTPAPVGVETKPEVTEAERRAAESRAAFLAAQDEAQAQLGKRKYGAAMAAFKTVADKYADLEVGKKAGDERQRILSVAWQDFNKIRERAGTLAAAGQYEGARQLYADALAFGVPEITSAVEQRRAELRDTETRQPAGTEGDLHLPANVRNFIQTLRTDKDPDRRSEAALSLGNVAAKAAVPDLIKALKDDAWIVRSRAAQSLGKLDDPAAIPALIDVLDDFATVAFDAHRALVALTKQSFAATDKAKWGAWYAENKAKVAPDSGAKPPEPERKSSFGAIVLERRYNPDLVRFALPDGTVLGAGTRVELVREGGVICTVSVDQVTKDQAFGKIMDLRAGAKLEAGDTVTVNLPK